MTEEILGQGPATPNPIHGQVGLSHRIEDLSTMVSYPRLEGGPQQRRLVTAGERPQFRVDQERLITREAVTPERPTGAVIRCPSIETPQRIHQVLVRDLGTRGQLTELCLERL